MDTLRLCLTLPTREMALQLTEAWPRRAGKIYEAVIRGLTEEEA